MNKSSNQLGKSNIKLSQGSEYGEFMDLLESGMEDYEIASELGVSRAYVTKTKREIYKDLI